MCYFLHFLKNKTTTDKAFFIFGYAKNVKANLTHDEKKLAKLFAEELLSYTDEVLDKLVKDKKLMEVNYVG